MHGAYAALEKAGKIGPNGPDGFQRPGYRAEYPKWVEGPDGKRVVVQSQVEELRLFAEMPQTPAKSELSALEQERDALATKVAQLEATLAAKEGVPNSPPKAEPKPPVVTVAPAKK